MANVRIKTKPPKESEIQRTICDYLAMKHHFFWRNNNTPVWQGGENARFRAMPKYSMRGISDIILVGKQGFAVFIEVKRPGGKLSEYQELFKAQCEKSGATYLVAESLDDIIAAGI